MSRAVKLLCLLLVAVLTLCPLLLFGVALLITPDLSLFKNGIYLVQEITALLGAFLGDLAERIAGLPR
jgi:hypothetical protein